MATRAPEASCGNHGVDLGEDPVVRAFLRASVVDDDRTPEQIEEERRAIEEWEAAGWPTVPGAVVTAEIAERARREG